MKASKKKIAILVACTTFALTSCDQERNKASLHDSADTLHTDNAKHKYEDGTLQRSTDSTTNNQDSVMNKGNVDPSGRMEENQ